jgi:hypothetical protein
VHVRPGSEESPALDDRVDGPVPDASLVVPLVLAGRCGMEATGGRGELGEVRRHCRVVRVRGKKGGERDPGREVLQDQHRGGEVGGEEARAQVQTQVGEELESDALGELLRRVGPEPAGIIPQPLNR